MNNLGLCPVCEGVNLIVDELGYGNCELCGFICDPMMIDQIREEMEQDEREEANQVLSEYDVTQAGDQD